MNKHEGNGPEVSPQWRRFFWHHRKEIVEMAWRLYQIAPFQEWDDESRWRNLIYRATTWLHNANAALDEVDRSLRHEAGRRAEKERAQNQRLPAMVPYPRA